MEARYQTDSSVLKGVGLMWVGFRVGDLFFIVGEGEV